MFLRRLTKPIAIAAATVAIGGGVYGIVNATAVNSSGATTAAASIAAAQGQPLRGSGRSNARSGPAAGGAVGRIDAMSTSSFTISTPAGQTVTVTKAPSTTYRKGASATSAAALRKGESVLVLGTVDGTTIAAGLVIEQPTGGGGSANPSGAKVVPFVRGAPSTSKQVGRVPATYAQGSGTIVTGTRANKATETALAAYPGGIVDRVVQLSNGEYEVHNIGVNWPHHIFVDQSFKVVGAN
jgi:hypothetical protein